MKHKNDVSSDLFIIAPVTDPKNANNMLLRPGEILKNYQIQTTDPKLETDYVA